MCNGLFPQAVHEKVIILISSSFVLYTKKQIVNVIYNNISFITCKVPVERAA